MFKYEKTLALSITVAIFASLLPAIASAQYGGGGMIVGSGPMAPGYVPTSNTPPTNSSAPQGQVLGASVYNFAVNFGYGTTDNDVTQLQTVLIADGYLHIKAPTGWFGPLTVAAVKEYQKTNNISPQSGYVGPLTRGVLNKGVAMTSEKQGLASEIVGTVEGLWNKWEATRAE